MIPLKNYKCYPKQKLHLTQPDNCISHLPPFVQGMHRQSTSALNGCILYMIKRLSLLLLLTLINIVNTIFC